MTDVIDKSLLGKLFTSQSTIDDEIDLKKISKIFSDNIDFIDQILQKKMMNMQINSLIILKKMVFLIFRSINILNYSF